MEKRNSGSILIDTMVAVLICSIIMSALVPLAIRLIGTEYVLMEKIILVFEKSRRLW